MDTLTVSVMKTLPPERQEQVFDLWLWLIRQWAFYSQRGMLQSARRWRPLDVSPASQAELREYQLYVDLFGDEDGGSLRGRQKALRAFFSLREREKRMLYARYGLGMTYAEIGSKHRCTSNRTRQICQHGLKTIRRRLYRMKASSVWDTDQLINPFALGRIAQGEA